MYLSKVQQIFGMMDRPKKGCAQWPNGLTNNVPPNPNQNPNPNRN